MRKYVFDSFFALDDQSSTTVANSLGLRQPQVDHNGPRKTRKIQADLGRLEVTLANPEISANSDNIRKSKADS